MQNTEGPLPKKQGTPKQHKPLRQSLFNIRYLIFISLSSSHPNHPSETAKRANLLS
jgi:hypothetical protein